MSCRHLILVFALSILAAPAWAQGMSTIPTCVDQSGNPQPKDTPCDEVCRVNPACDGNGHCVGQIASDGTPCDEPGCSAGAACENGICQCGAVVNHDLGPTGGHPNTGCSFDGVTGGGFAALSILGLVALTLFTRRRKA